MKLKAGMLLLIIVLLFAATSLLLVRSSVDAESTPVVKSTLVDIQMENTAVYPTQQPLIDQNESDGVYIPCDPNEHQDMRKAD